MTSHYRMLALCREVSLRDAELARLCAAIQTTQRQEIEQMQSILARLDRAQ